MKKFIDYLEMLKNKSEAYNNNIDVLKDYFKFLRNGQVQEANQLLPEILRTHRHNPNSITANIYQTQDWAKNITPEQWKELRAKVQNLKTGAK